MVADDGISDLRLGTAYVHVYMCHDVNVPSAPPDAAFTVDAANGQKHVGVDLCAATIADRVCSPSKRRGSTCVL